MKLIGMLDSPYVRRVAVALECLGVPFEHEAISVFSTFEKFRSVNPVVKAPTLICDDGEVVMDSSLILQLVEATKTGGRSLWPPDPVDLQHAFRAASLALAACEKSVQMVYEVNLRPASARYAPWLARVRGQLLAAYAGLEREIGERGSIFAGVTHASIAAAVAWQFTQSELSKVVPADKHPLLVRLSQRMESLLAFRKYPPVGPGVQAAR
ncbi:MAG: glutathione S-transferase [Betaproteobacteria bacterium]|nr:glutathione S-transferase [Betaproteobacteria bacterium]MDH5221525.1 glutathione S-transferase [Betaproteobacteria bacterium]MDH5349464.1 glutathione S-transferase [Betaproteobacteria bacterium]